MKLKQESRALKVSLKGKVCHALCQNVQSVLMVNVVSCQSMHSQRQPSPPLVTVARLDKIDNKKHGGAGSG